MVRTFATGVLLAAAAGPATSPYRMDVERWRHAREASLHSDTGWLTVVGLFWLKEGPNRFGTAADNDIVLTEGAAHAGVFRLREGRTVLRMGGETRELKPDDPGPPDLVHVGNLTLFVIHRGDRFGIRLRDRNSKARHEFKGLHWYPVKREYRVRARFVAQPAKVAVGNVLGQTEEMTSPGYVEFQLGGQPQRLYPVLESPDAKSLFFILRDQTSGHETYGAGRFLDSGLPKDGQVVLDFNKAYNPPCAFTPYATCPLPPRQNRLPVRIEAGEMKYTDH
jgi:uncharacterized protein (DUF1684 family)